jgi:hypothetical protein
MDVEAGNVDVLMNEPTNTDTAKQLPARAARSPVTGVVARLGASCSGEVVNISVGGVLMRLTGTVRIGNEETLVLVKGSDVLTTRARVLRVTADIDPASTSCIVAAQFVSLSDDARAVLPQLIRPMKSQSSRSLQQ